VNRFSYDRSSNHVLVVEAKTLGPVPGAVCSSIVMFWFFGAVVLVEELVVEELELVC
jgi:hypothetical protein